MKILVTGASGLVGRNVVELFQTTAHELLTPGHRELDLLERGQVQEYLRAHKPECVVHLAAKVGSIASNVRDPFNFFLENLDMGRNVVVCAYEAGIKRLVNLASACVYPADSHKPFSEEMTLTGAFEREYKGYASGKAIALLLCQFLSSRNSQLLYKTLIPCSIYGRWSSFAPDKATMIASAIRKVYEAKKKNFPSVPIWGDGLACRELIYAGDLAKIILFAVEHLEKLPPLLNVGTGISHSVNECYKTVAKLLGYSGNFVHDLSKPSGTAQRLLDVRLMHSLGLKAETSLEDGIRQTILFYEKHFF